MGCRMDEQDFGQWAILEVSGEKGQAIFRVRTDRPEDPAVPQLGTCIKVRWSYEEAAGGFPGGDDRESMDEFEEAIDELTSDNGFSYLMLVTTGMGMKEWMFYTADEAAFMERFNDLLWEMPEYPIRVLHSPDEEWTEWESIRKHAQ
jgi:hypothetical protein